MLHGDTSACGAVLMRVLRRVRFCGWTRARQGNRLLVLEPPPQVNESHDVLDEEQIVKAIEFARGECGLNSAGPIIDEVRALLDRANVLREPSDFDLLVFFARHPRTLLTSESLARLLGYEPKDIARSLDSLIECGLLTRTQTSAHAARLYVFVDDAAHDWIPPLLRMAGTRTGRLALRQVLATRTRDGREGHAVSNSHDAGTSAPRSVVLRMTPDLRDAHGSDAKAG